jgi:hypothetical protein
MKNDDEAALKSEAAFLQTVKSPGSRIIRQHLNRK